MLKNIAIFGAGGFGREVACLIKMINESEPEPRWELVGFFDDDPNLKGKTVSQEKVVLGGLSELNNWDSSLDIVIAIANPLVLKKVVERIDNPLLNFPNLIAPSTIFLDRESVRMGKGNVVCSRCLISCDVEIGDYNIFDGNIPVGHDVELGNCNVVMPSVNISGGVKMGDCNFLGVQSVVLQNIRLDNRVRLGANSVLMNHAKEGQLYLGNPAKKIEL